MVKGHEPNKHEEFNRLFSDLDYKPEVKRAPNDIQALLKITNNTYYAWKNELKAKEQTSDFDNFIAKLKSEATTGKNAQFARLYYDYLGLNKKEDSTKSEFSPSDRIRIAIQIRDDLRREYETSGNCPVCNRCKVLRHSICMDSESELEQGGEVATVAVSP